MDKRWKSPVLWMSLLALFAFVMKNWAGVEIPHLDEFAELLLAALAALGVINNPTDKAHL